MYHIFYGNNIIFDPYGNENEVVTNASLNASINAASYLDFTMAITHPLYDVIAEKSGIVKLLWDDNVLFEGQIESIDIDMRGNKTISCVSALDYLNDTIVRPYSTISGERPLTAPSSVDGYFQWLIDQHNLHVKDSSKMFYVGVNQGANLQYNNFIYRSSSNNPTTASEITNQILDSLGGYLTMRYEDGLHVLDLYSDVHTMNAQIIDFGVNLKDFSKKIKTNEQYTALIAKGGSPQFLNGGFESGDFGYWETHPDTEITTAKAQEGSYSSYIVEGVATYIPTSFFYAKKNGRYKSTFYVKNERSSDVTVHAGYETNVLDLWSKSSEQQAFVIKNDDQWHECVFEFTVNVEDNTKVRPYWYSDNISNAGGARVYFDGFAFTRTISGNPVSEDPIDISLIPDGGTQYDSNVLKSDDVIYNPDRVSRYGYREKVFTDSTITDLDDLMQAAIKELNKLAEPTIGLDVKAVDLALYMDGYTHLTVGDAVRVRSAIHDTDEYLMVTSINLNLEDPGNSEYVIGQAYDSLTGQQSGYLRSLSSGINSSLDAVAALDETTKDQAIKIGSVTDVANKAQETANTANIKAENAQTSADNAQSAANANKAEIDASNAEIEAAKQGIADAEAEIGIVNGRINSMNGEIDTVNGHISSMNNKIAGINGRIDSMNDEIGAVNGIIDSTNDRIDSMNGEIETVSGNVDTLRNDLNTKVSGLNTQIETVSGSVDSLRTEVSTEVQNVKDSVDAVSSKADSAMDKASILAGNLESTNAIVNQHSDKIGELTTSISNATTKADSALQVATEATQTANSFKTTATTAYENANEALTKSSTAVQKADEVSLNLSTNYQTKADSDALYATKASLKATSDSITSTVEKTYATKSSVEALQNIADSAIETWVGSVVPTGENEPASHWNTAELKRQHSGDIYYDSETGYSYRYGSTDGTVYSWTMIKDSDIQKAIQDAANAQLAAEGAKDSVDQLALDIPNIYATKSELTQTSDSIKATVSETSKTATSALNKATSVEQTANGLKATVTEQGTKLDDAVKTVNKVSAKADSLSTSITQTNNKLNGYMLGELSNKGFETGDLTGWSKTDGFATIQVVDKKWGYKVNTGNCSMMMTTPTKADSYLICSDTITIHGGHKYKVTCYFNDNNSFRQYFRLGLRFGSKASEYQYVYHKFMSVFSTNFYLVEAIIEAPATLANSTATSYPGNICFGTDTKWTNNIRLYVDDFTIEDVTALEAANSSATEALTKATQVEQTVDSFKTSVSETLKTTTETLNGLVAGGFTNLGFERGTLDEWETSESFGTVSLNKYAISGKWSLESKSPMSSGGYLKSTKSFDAKPYHTYRLSVTLKFLSDSLKFKFGLYAGHTEANSVYLTEDFTLFSNNDKTFTTEVTIPNNFYGEAYPAYLYLELASNVTTANRYLDIDDFTIEDITDVKNVADDASAALEKASTLEQTVDGFKTTVSQTYETKEDALKKESSVNQRVDSITSTVSEQAKKLNQTVTTVSEVKQTADSLTSQISQATTDASSANDKASSALTKASSLEQSLNGFKTTVSQTYETKQDALNKQSTLNQTIDGFKTTVSQTYTTKTDFNNLQIGGTNRALLTGTPKTITGNGGANQSMDLYTMPSTGYELFGGDDVMISYDITASGNTLSGTYIIQGNGHPGWTFAPGPQSRKLSDIGNGNTLHVKDKVKFGSSSSNNFNGLQIRMDNASGTLTISNFKIEKGNKATAWSPAPEDVGYTYATKSEVTQTANSLKSSISQTNKNIEGITTNVIKNPGFETGGLEQWSIDGGMSNVYVNNQNPHGDSYKLVIVTPSTGYWTMKSNTITVVKNHTYEISCWVWADKAVNAKLGIYAGGYYSTNDVAISASTSWQRISVRCTLQNGYSDARISFGFSDAISESNNIRVDDFELRDITEGYDASGVANSALTKASTLEQTLDGFKTTVSQTYETKTDALNKQSTLNQTIDGFKTTVSQTYETKQDALNKQSTLNQTIDGFKTTVSQTYATKTDFNNLQIGGTNRALLTGTPKTITGNGGANQSMDLYTMPSTGYELFGGDDVMISYDITASGNTLSGTYIIQGNGHPGWTFAPGPQSRKLSDIGNGNTLHVKDKVKFGSSSSNNFNGLQIRMDNASGTLTISNFKIEKGNKATAWSPAPEDVGYTYATKSEVTQTANSLKSSISQTNKNIEGITTNVIKNPGFETGGLEQWSIDGGMSNVYVNNQNPHGDSYKLVIVTPSTGYWTMKSNTITVVKNHTYEISCWVWADKAVNAKLGIYAGGYYSTNDVAISASTSWQRISVRCTLQNGYSDARISFGFSDAISESNNIRVDDFELRDITEGYDASGVANSALTKASTLEQTLDGFKTTVSQTYETKTDALNKQSTLNQTIDGFKTTVSQTYETKQDALNKQSTLNQTIDGFKTTVSQTYATKTSLNALSNQADITYAMSVISGKQNYWIRLGTATISEQGRITQLTLNASKDNNGQPDQNAKVIIQIHRGWTGGDANHQFGVSVDNANWKEIQVKAFSNATNKVTIWIYNSVASYLKGNYTVSGWRDSWEDQGLTQTGAPAGTEQQVAMNVSLEDVNDKATSALTKSSELEQTLDGFKTTVSQTYETKTDSLAKQSTLNQKVDSLRSEVSETYATKTALNNASSTTNMWPNQWFDTSKPCIGRAPVGNEIEAAPVGGNIRIIDSRDHYNGSVSSSVMPGRKYKVSVDAKKVSGTKSVISGGIWYTVQSSGTSWDGVGDFAKVKDYGNNWYRFERTVTVPNGKTMGTAWLQHNENSGSSNPAKWKISNLRFEDVTDMADIQANYSTKSYVDQTARTVSLGVVEEYKNGQHGSALATQSDISMAKDSITSTVSKTYTTISDFNNLQISGGRNIARDTKAFGRNNVTSSDSGWLSGYVDRTNGTYKGCTVRSLTSSAATGQQVFQYDVYNTNLGEYYTLSFWAKGSGKMRLYCYGPSGYLKAKRVASSDGQAASTIYNDGATDITLYSGWRRYWVVWLLDDNPPGGYSTTKQFLLRNDNKMSSCDVCGVMIEKGNKASEWAPAPEDIEKTYATKSEVKQTVDGLNVTISGLQSTANNASSNAANAQNRVGNLETCIKMTADGVRVGKIDNGNFSGYSALVNSAGSFDIVDAGGNTCSSFNQNTIKLGENNNDSVVDMVNGTAKFYGNAGSNTLNIDTRDKGPIVINGYDLGLLGRSCLLQQATTKTTAQTGRFVNVPLKVTYINTKGQCATTIEPFTQDGGGIRVNVKGLYLISIAGVPTDVKSTDILRLSLGTNDQKSYIQIQWMAGESGNMGTHTEMRILDANQTYYLQYACDQGGGSNITGGFVTITFMGYLQ